MITSAEMAELERLSEQRGIPPLRLMETAGAALADIIVERFRPRKVLVVCYHGNNGGDGFVAARMLQHHVKVRIAFLGRVEKLRGEALLNYERLDPRLLVSFPSVRLEDYDLLVDAMLGTGAKGPLREPLASAVRAMNASNVPIVAVDVPTGLDPDTGERSDPVIDAELIVTFHDIKTGLVKAGLQERCVVVDIGIQRST